MPSSLPPSFHSPNMRGVITAIGVLLCEGLSVSIALAGSTVTVKITAMAFDLAEITITAGDTVVWENDDFLDHTATESSGAWDVVLRAGASAGRTFLESGTTSYYCRFHPNMTGTIRALPP